MKTQLTNLALTAALGLAITFTLTACGKGGGDVKLLETITDENGNVQRFEYDKQNRIVKMGDKTITYSDNLITVGTRKFVINGNTVTEGDNSFTVNKDGHFELEGYKYKDGNLIFIDYGGESGNTVSFSYDDKKSPFSNSSTPKWLFQYLFGLNLEYAIYASKNNLVNYEGDSGHDTYEYEYDNDGFPVKSTRTVKWEGNHTIITRFTYRGETKTATAQTEPPAAKTETAASESQPSEEGPPITIEAVFSRSVEDEGMSKPVFSLPSGEEIWFNDEVKEVKECDKVSITYKTSTIYSGYYESYIDVNSIISLKKIGSGVKLLESITYESGNAIRKFEYDKKNRIVKIDDKTITYADNLITVGKDGDNTKYVINGNTITRGADEFTINKEGFIVFQGYEYKDGNIIRAVCDKYDDKKSPLSNINTPKWLLQKEFWIIDPSKNNALILYEDIGEEGFCFNYEYEYDGGGFPIKRTKEGLGEIEITRYTYLCGTKN